MAGTSLLADDTARAHAAVCVQGALFVLGSVILAVMAVAAHSLAYFPIDPAISQAVQAYHPAWLDTATSALSWTGFPPQSDVLFGLVVASLFGLRMRWTALAALIAAVGSGGLYLLLEQLVGQPRPSADLVRVAGPIQLSGFPSGHLATFTAIFGFMAFVGYHRFSPSIWRWLPVALVGVLLILMSFARIYAGQHWASDVLGGCLLGVLWLAVTIRIYWWGESRFSRRQYIGSHSFEGTAPVDRAVMNDARKSVVPGDFG